MKAILFLTLLSNSPVLASADGVATVENSKKTVNYVEQNGTIFFSVSDAAAAFGWEFKVIRKGKLLLFCRGGQEELCIPVQLTDDNFFVKDGKHYLASSVLGKALSFQAQKKNGSLQLAHTEFSNTEEVNLPAYNAKWGKNRGFRKGQTLPDIPLYDLQGNEVRFSKYLGKQCIIYCWASW